MLSVNPFLVLARVIVLAALWCYLLTLIIVLARVMVLSAVMVLACIMVLTRVMVLSVNPHYGVSPCPYLIFVISFTPAIFFNPIILHPKITKNTQNLQQIAPKSVKYALFEFNLENLTPDRICLHRHRCSTKCSEVLHKI